MKHSVLCRAEEIQTWVGTETEAMASRLEQEQLEFNRLVRRSGLSDDLKASAERHSAHLATWAEALRLGME